MPTDAAATGFSPAARARRPKRVRARTSGVSTVATIADERDRIEEEARQHARRRSTPVGPKRKPAMAGELEVLSKRPRRSRRVPA